MIEVFDKEHNQVKYTNIRSDIPAVGTSCVADYKQVIKGLPKIAITENYGEYGHELQFSCTIEKGFSKEKKRNFSKWDTVEVIMELEEGAELIKKAYNILTERGFYDNNKMVKADFSGDYLNSENAKDDDIITITGKATVEEKQGLNGKYKSTNIPVEINGLAKIYSPSRESGLKMVTAWGDEMDTWVGKQATIKHVLKQVKGETKKFIECYPIEAKKVK